MEKEYYLGLDLGTASVGWAVTDTCYNVMRAHGKALWGVRLFERAKSAEERRLFRTGRRRLERRNWRLELLQELFADEINKVDEGFFRRMKESVYTPDDKRDLNGNCPELPYALFVDKNYTDKDYHKQFPSIYHLRKWLMETEETPDIRLVYLALHHIMKHRGHFLLSGNIENIKEFKGTFEKFKQSLMDEELDFHLCIGEEALADVEAILRDRNLSRSAKKTRLTKRLEAKSSCEKAVLNLISGGTVKLKDIFSEEDLDETERPKLSFADSTYEEYAPVIEQELGEKYSIIESAKAVYDWAVLADILDSYSSISEAKVAVYEKHKQDLAYLKKAVKGQLGNTVYKKVFVETNAKFSNYPAYIGMTKQNGKKLAMEGKLASKEEFYAFLKKEVVSKLRDENTVQYLNQEIEKETFLPKQVIKDNGVLPHQIHLYELDKIIDNLKDKIEILNIEKDKIRQLFTFRIPYYVGPLNGIMKGEKRTNWAERYTNNKIYPWNFDEVVNKEASAEHFIRRMINKCTYLLNEDVLPKNSLLYAKFTVLNELNNLRLNGEPISVAQKQKIYEGLFQRHRKITQKKLRDFLVREGIAPKTVEITGIDGDFKGSLTAYHDFKEKLTGNLLTREQMEEIILNITLFGEDKELLKQRIKKLCPDLTKTQRDAICTLSYQGWGRLSGKFLEGLTAPAPETGEVWTVIRALWETNDNLMQILSEKYLFTEAIEHENMGGEKDKISYKMVDELYVSPAVKRQIWQTLQIVQELSKVLGKPPKRIFVEMARENAEKKRTESRKNHLMDLYKKCKSEQRDWVAELGETPEQKLRSDKLYLYYTQKGRCMYSGEIIELEELWDNHRYDIDHIYPQSKVMDDSLDNRVLVKKTYNAEKTDHYPIRADIREKQRPFWKALLDGGFISKEKYQRLIRGTEFEPDELAGFISRQLVETRQGTKAVASILQQCLPETEIVYSKAKTTSEFRHQFGLAKVREMNDLHHAKDAYLNIVVGNVYYTKFTKNAAWFIKNNPGRSYNLKRMFDQQDVVRNGETAWRAGEHGTIVRVRETMRKNNIIVTRRSYQVTGGLFDQQLMKKGKGQVPIKSSDDRLCNIEKYGGYNKAAGTYFMLVESEDKKGKKMRTVEYVPLYLAADIERNEASREKYLTESRELKKPKVLIEKIKIDSLFKVDGFYMWLSGRTEDRLLFKNANQLLLSEKDALVLKKIIKFVGRLKENKELKITEFDRINETELIGLYDVFLSKIRDTVYFSRLSAQVKTLTEKREAFMNLTLEEKCVVLSEILHMFQCQSASANLKLIGGPASAGIVKIGNEITKLGQILLINQSPTGIYEQEIDLKKI